MNNIKQKATGAKSERNPLYVKIGKRIRQARLMAQESNSRNLSLRLGWSGGRLHNYETGLSTPGVDETLQFCAALGVQPCWITYGVGAPRPSELHAPRYRKFMQALDRAETSGELEAFLQAVRLPLERMRKFRKNPYTKIPTAMARRCEKYLGRRSGWIDETMEDTANTHDLHDDARQILSLYQAMNPAEKEKFQAIGRLLLD